MNDYEIQKLKTDIHKRKCEELRKVRVAMAKNLGVPEVVRDEPCNFKGECQGTCPACYMEEKALMDRIYELSKNGVVLTLKGNEFEKEPEPVIPPIKPPVLAKPPIVQGGIRPMPPDQPIVQGMIRPMPPMSPIDPPAPEPEPETKKRGIFERIKKEK